MARNQLHIVRSKLGCTCPRTQACTLCWRQRCLMTRMNLDQDRLIFVPSPFTVSLSLPSFTAMFTSIGGLVPSLFWFQYTGVGGGQTRSYHRPRTQGTQTIVFCSVYLMCSLVSFSIRWQALKGTEPSAPTHDLRRADSNVVKCVKASSAFCQSCAWSDNWGWSEATI